MRRSPLFALLLALALVAAACGGGDDEAVETDDDVAADTSDSSDADDTGDASDSDDADDSGDADDVDLPDEGSGSNTDFCQRVQQLTDDADAFDPFGGPEVIRAYFEETSDLSSELVSMAPSEVEDDARILNEAFDAMIEILEEYDYDFFAIPTEVIDQPPFENPEADAADDRIEAFCGLDTSSDIGDDVLVPDAEIPESLSDMFVQQFLDEGFDQETAECLAETVGDFTNNSELMTPENLADPNFEICGMSFQEAFG